MSRNADGRNPVRSLQRTEEITIVSRSLPYQRTDGDAIMMSTPVPRSGTGAPLLVEARVAVAELRPREGRQCVVIKRDDAEPVAGGSAHLAGQSLHFYGRLHERENAAGSGERHGLCAGG